MNNKYNLIDIFQQQQKLDNLLKPPIFKVLEKIQEQNKWLTSVDAFIVKSNFPQHIKPTGLELLYQSLKTSEAAKSWSEVISNFQNDKTENEEIKNLIITEFNFEDEVKNNSKLHFQVINESSLIERLIADIYNNNRNLYNLKPRQFEELVAELLRNNGFEVQLTKQTRDNGYDIIAIQNMNKLNPIKFLVECKLYGEDKPIGINTIRSFCDVVNREGANRGIIVTSSYFSSIAIKREQDMPYLLEFKDRIAIINWVEDYVKSKGLTTL
jgi:restriction endonuclease Mrr